MPLLMPIVLLVLPSVAAYSCVTAGPHCTSGLSRPVAARAAVHAVAPPAEDGSAAMAERMSAMTESGRIMSTETYGVMLSTLLNTNENLEAQISANYAMVDYAFLQRLEELIGQGNEENIERLRDIKTAVNSEMAKRMTAAAQAMKDLVTSPTPIVMEGKIAALARQGRIDDALMQLLEANKQQAEAAGEAGAGAVRVLSRLQQRVQTEMDTKLPKQVSLLRRLLRMDDADARQKLLREKMKPKQGSSGILLSTVSKQEQEDAKSTEPDVPPRLLAAAIQDIKLRFGNVDEQYDTGFVKRLEEIAEEAEAIALDLAGGKELSARQAQDMAWDQASVSVWDLEQVEEEAHAEGKLAVWEDEAQAQMARQDSAMRKKAIDTDYQR